MHIQSRFNNRLIEDDHESAQDLNERVLVAGGLISLWCGALSFVWIFGDVGRHILRYCLEKNWNFLGVISYDCGCPLICQTPHLVD